VPRMLALLFVLIVGPAAGPAAAAPVTRAPVATVAAVAGWSWPLPGAPTVTRPFQPPPSPYGPGHRGVDLAGAPGNPVLAAGDGVVAFAGMVAGRPLVSIDSPTGLRTTYEPVAPSVAAGQPVARGSPIGTLLPGHAGCPASACLHWGLRRGESYLDPLDLLRPPQVRLLPWTG
jgi:murein DD-endopeptidase MepM/ murein hydrolase activator NlpD